MDYNTIEDEVYSFLDDYFSNELDVVDENLDLIENNKLITPKIDYTFIYEYLVDTLNRFEILDSGFSTPTIKKLKSDIKYLIDAHEKFEKKATNPKEIFKSKFSQNSLILKKYARHIFSYQNNLDKSPTTLNEIKRLKDNLSKLKKIYYEVFNDVYFENKNNLSANLKLSINTKIFYFDRLIWKYAKKSKIIVKHLEIRKMEGEFSSKVYLSFIMSMMRPYTDEYRYLQKCLKVYK